MHIRRVKPDDFDEWLRMRLLLWSGHPAEDFLKEMDMILADPDCVVFVAVRPKGGLCGFLEASRRKYAEGCDTSPVGYLEGWYVDADQRRNHVGAQLVQAAEAWAKESGLHEMASDCIINNEISFNAHEALGYKEVERLIHFRKQL